jgi:TetR/AcrR family tetracycline transcriptional repressor
MARPRQIERDQIVTAALVELAEVGPDRFTLSGVARRLGVTAPALYNHYTDKGDILREAARRVFSEDLPGPEDYAPERYADFVVARCLATYRRACEHPGAAAALLAHVPRETVDDGVTVMTRLMKQAGLAKRQREHIAQGALRLVWGWIVVSQVFDPQPGAAPPLKVLEAQVRALIRGLSGTVAEEPTRTTARRRT